MVVPLNCEISRHVLSALEEEMKLAACDGKLFIGPSPDAKGSFYLLLANDVSFQSFAPVEAFASIPSAREEVKMFLGKWQVKASQVTDLSSE